MFLPARAFGIVHDRATGAAAWTYGATARDVSGTLEAWADAQLQRTTNPHTPQWKSAKDLTPAKAEEQAAMKRQWRKETRERGLVEAQAKIEGLRDRGALFVVSHSGGKDSQAMAILVNSLVPEDQIVWVHAPLKGAEWAGSIDQVKRYKPRGVPLLMADAIDSAGDEKWLLDWVILKLRWPDQGRRWCTSDFKRGPIRREVKAYADEHGFNIIVDAQGLRAQESEKRATSPALTTLEKEHGVRSRALGEKREWWSWSPIKWMDTDEVFQTIEGAGEKPMWTYQEGLTRASCAFCVLGGIPDLRRAAELAPELYAAYVATEHYLAQELPTVKLDKPRDRDARRRRKAAGLSPHPWPPTIKTRTRAGNWLSYPLEEVTGIKADPKLVRKYLKEIERTGSVHSLPAAGMAAYRRSKRGKGKQPKGLPIVQSGGPAFGQMEFGAVGNPGQPFEDVLEEWIETRWGKLGDGEEALEVELTIECDHETTEADEKPLETAVRRVLDAALAETQEGQERFKGRGWGRATRPRWREPMVFTRWKKEMVIYIAVPDPQTPHDAHRLLYALTRLNDSAESIAAVCNAEVKASAKKVAAKKAAKRREPRAPKKKAKKKAKKKEPDFMAMARAARREGY